MDDFIIQYCGISPSEFAQKYVAEAMKRLHVEAPDGSTLRVMISNRGDRVFRGVVRINSPAGTFCAVGASTKIPELTRQLVSRSRRQIDKWKSRRFSHESLRYAEAVYGEREAN